MTYDLPVVIIKGAACLAVTPLYEEYFVTNKGFFNSLPSSCWASSVFRAEADSPGESLENDFATDRFLFVSSCFELLFAWECFVLLIELFTATLELLLSLAVCLIFLSGAPVELKYSSLLRNNFCRRSVLGEAWLTGPDKKKCWSEAWRTINCVK